MDGNPGEPESVSSVLVDLKDFRKHKDQLPITFHRRELDAILRLYSRMVGEGEWRDYAIDHLKDKAVFSVIAASGMIVKRGQDLAQVLKVFDKKPKLVRG